MERNGKRTAARRNGFRRISLARIAGIARLVGERYRSRRVILYGSYAYGKPHSGSDIDLLVVTSRSRRKRFRSGSTGVWGRIPGISVQLAFMGIREFEETRDIVGGLAYPATHGGRTLYEKDA